MSVAPGQIINGKYRITRHIGDGGMGSVYEAIHEALGARVALKFLHAELGRTGLIHRFLQEARLSARIQSPHVVRVTDADQTPDSLAFIVLEYLEGPTLQAHYEDLYRRGTRLSLDDALDFAMQLFEGVEAAHAAGVVHRDLKPDNVMITTDGKGAPLLKVLDFGIAKLGSTEPVAAVKGGLTQPGMILGTPEYMAPEQAYSADSADVRADVFSLGVILFEMIAGRRPAAGDGPYEIASAYLSGQIARLDQLEPAVPRDLAEAVHKAMAALPRNRFASAREFREAVEPFAPLARPAPTNRGRASRASLPATGAAAVFPDLDGPLHKVDTPARPQLPETWAHGAGPKSALPGLPSLPGVSPDAPRPPPGPWPPPAEWSPAGPSIPQPPPPRRRKSNTGTIVLIATLMLGSVGGLVIWSIYYFTDTFDDPPPKKKPVAPVPTPTQPRPPTTARPPTTVRPPPPTGKGNLH